MKRYKSISELLWDVLPKIFVGSMLIYTGIRGYNSQFDPWLVFLGILLIIWGIGLLSPPKYSTRKNGWELKAFITFSVFLMIGVLVDNKVDSLKETVAIISGIVVTTFVWFLKLE